MKKKKILIVDDEKDLTFLISDMIEDDERFDVCVANDGQEAMAKIEEIKPDIIFLDFVMPKVKGDEVLNFIREKCAHDVSIVLMSGLGEMVYFKDKDGWAWQPNNKVVHERGDLPESLKWKRGPEEIAKEFKVKAFIPKPFSKEVFWEVLEDICSSE